MVQKLKATWRSMAGVTEHDDAVELELEAQLWSMDQPAFHERLGGLKRRITKQKS
jgi:hypothetical protein